MMRPVYICACLAACLALPALAAEMPSLPPDLTVILDFKGAWSPQTVQEMQREASRIIGPSGIQLGWISRGDAGQTTFNDLVVMTFKGSCTYVPAPPRYDELGPYASTRTANGEVQPFGDVDCDRVVSSVRAAMFGGDFAKADILVGRALGRVVAHELVHMLTRSDVHGQEGVQKAALSGKQLIAASLPLSAFDLDRLRLERKLP
jgi:hypothetical protein